MADHAASSPPAAADRQEGYRALCPLAVVALLAGLAAWLALLHPALWIVPGVGALLAALALRQIRRSEGELSGRWIALAGLSLSLVFGAAAPTRLLSDQWWLAREAEQAADQWFALLREGHPERAYQLTIAPHVRRPPADDLRQHYRQDALGRKGLETFANHRLVRPLLQLGAKARARRFETQWVVQRPDSDEVGLVYSVTYDDDRGRKTFFARVALKRTINPHTGEPGWQVTGYVGGVTPLSLR